MTKQELLETLTSLEEKDDPNSAHILADECLLNYEHLRHLRPYTSGTHNMTLLSNSDCIKQMPLGALIKDVQDDLFEAESAIGRLELEVSILLERLQHLITPMESQE